MSLRPLAIVVLAVATSARANIRCKPEWCKTWDAAWTGSFVNIMYSPATPAADMVVGGVWFRIDNKNSRQVRVCFSYTVTGKNGLESALDRSKHQYTQYDVKLGRVGSIQVDDTWGCVTADPNSEADDDVVTNVTLTHYNHPADISVVVYDVHVDVAGTSSAASPPDAEPAPAAIDPFERATAGRKRAAPQVATRNHACLTGDPAACGAPHVETPPDQLRACFAAQRGCQANASSRETTCWLTKCDPIRAAARSQHKKWYGDTSELKWESCNAKCTAAAGYEACPRCALPTLPPATSITPTH